MINMEKGIKRFSLKVFLVSLIIVATIAHLGSLFTSNTVNSSWYESIKPAITPPNYVFPIVWTILFILIALSMSYAWNSSKKKLCVVLLFGANLILNLFWSILYFGVKSPIAAFSEVIFLFLSILLIIIYYWKTTRISSYLMFPYLLWVGFASILNYLSI